MTSAGRLGAHFGQDVVLVGAADMGVHDWHAASFAFHSDFVAFGEATAVMTMPSACGKTTAAMAEPLLHLLEHDRQQEARLHARLPRGNRHQRRRDARLGRAVATPPWRIQS